jgi:methionine salvage enolase-phosphatase E1
LTCFADLLLKEAHLLTPTLAQTFTSHFDTRVGLKGEQASYTAICAAIGANPSEVLFITDMPNEARAALAAGLQVRLSVRPGNAPLTPEESSLCPKVTSFDQVVL